MANLISVRILSGPLSVAARCVAWLVVAALLAVLADYLGALQLARWEAYSYAALCADGVASACGPAATLARWGLGAGL